MESGHIFNKEFYIAYAVVVFVIIYLVYGWWVVGWFVNFVDILVMCTLLRDVTNISTSTDFMRLAYLVFSDCVLITLTLGEIEISLQNCQL